MNPIQKMKKSPHYPHLRQSLEYYHCRKQFIVNSIVCGVTVILTCIVLFMGADGRGNDAKLVIYVMLSMFFLGYWIYTGHQWLGIFRHMDDYVFFPVTLTKPIVSHTRYSASVRYTLTFPNSQGEIITRETASMFHNYSDPCLQDYNNRTVLIGYNEETDRVAVIKRLDG